MIWIKSKGLGILFLCSTIFLTSANRYYDFSLLATCPQNLSLSELNECIITSGYSVYEVPTKRFSGELKRGLPKAHDGYTPQQIDLGRYLFFDPLLSGNNSISCASCHQPNKNFTDGISHEFKDSKGNVVGKRETPSLWNVAFQNTFFWDARTSNLQDAVAGQLFSKEVMNSSAAELMKKINGVAEYKQMFKDAFGLNSEDTIQLNQVTMALAAFQSSLVSINSRFDQYVHGDIEALSPKEIRGMNLFRSFFARCAECHTPPLFTNNEVAVNGVVELESNPDLGAGAVYQNPKLEGAFKVPSLRNISNTAPYMHGGNFKSLKEVVSYYGGMRKGTENAEYEIDSRIHSARLSMEEINYLVAFLNTLSDESNIPEIPENLPSGLTPTGSAVIH